MKRPPTVHKGGEVPHNRPTIEDRRKKILFFSNHAGSRDNCRRRKPFEDPWL